MPRLGRWILNAHKGLNTIPNYRRFFKDSDRQTVAALNRRNKSVSDDHLFGGAWHCKELVKAFEWFQNTGRR